MTKNPLGKQAILDAAAVLIAERGVEGVSMGEILRASGHRNRSAVAYHFGGKDPLILALAESTVVPADRRRVELLDALEATSPTPSLRQVLAVAVAPMGEALQDAAGRQRLRLLGQLASHARYRSDIGRLLASIEGLGRCVAHLVGHMGAVPAPVLDERIALMSSFALRSYADRALAIDGDGDDDGGPSPEAFTTIVTDLLVAMARAPVTTDPDGGSGGPTPA